MAYSNFQLNQRISYLEYIIQQIAPQLPLDLEQILSNGNSAGTNDIDLNNNDILNVDNIDVTTINGGAYPPPPVSADLTAVLTAGDDAGGLDITNLNNLDVTTINGGAYPPVVPADDLSAVLIAGNTANNFIELTDGTQINQLQKTSIAFTNPISNGTSSMTANGLQFTTDNPALSSAGVSIATTATQANISLGVAGLPSPPYPAPDASIGMGVNTSTYSPTIQFYKSAPFQPTEILTFELNNITHNNSGSSNLGISSTNAITLAGDNVDLDATGRLIVPSLASTNYIDYNTGKLSVINSSVGGTANPLLVLQNNNNTAGSVAIETYKNKATGAVGDTIANWSMWAKDYTGTKTEFARINSTITNSSAGAGNDGAVNIWASVNGTISNVFTFNGADNENNTFRPLDLTGNDLKTSSGNMLINALASTGTGNITISPKTTLTLNSPLTPIQATNDLQMATDKQILLTDSSPNVVATTLGNGEIKVDDITGLSRTQMRPTDYYIIDTNTGDNTSYSINGFTKSDNSIQCNSNNGFVMNYGSTINKTTLDLTKLEMYNTGGGGLLADTILLQNTGSGNPVLNLYSTDANTGNSAQMGASNSSIGITQTNTFVQSKSLSMNNTLAGAGSLQYTNNVDSASLTISSNTSLELTTGNALVLNGGSLLDISAGGTSGQHLVLTINGSQYKIALLNP